MFAPRSVEKLEELADETPNKALRDAIMQAIAQARVLDEFKHKLTEGACLKEDFFARQRVAEELERLMVKHNIGPRMAHSKSEYKRLKAQGADVIAPADL